MKLKSYKLTILFFTIGVLSEQAMAASVYSSAFLGEGNEMFGHPLGTDGFSIIPFETVTGSGGSTHSFGDGETLEFNAQASASASYNTLRSSASGSLINSFYDAAYDFDNSTGVPVTFYSQGQSSFTQTLQYGGTAVNYTSTYILHVTGTISGNARAAVSITLTHASQAPQEWFYDAVGDYDLIIYSQAYIHGGFAQDFTLRINTLYSFGTISLVDGEDYSGAADFGNTLEVVGIDLRDDSGTLLPQGSITSDSGQVFNITGVPEPSAMLLTFLGAGLLFRRSRSCVS